MKSTYYDGSRGITVDLLGRDKIWIVTRVEVHKDFRGRGYAREMMERVCADADVERVNLILSVEPDGTGAGQDQLIGFYGSLGFEIFERDQHAVAMLRRPR